MTQDTNPIPSVQATTTPVSLVGDITSLHIMQPYLFTSLFPPNLLPCTAPVYYLALLAR